MKIVIAAEIFPPDIGGPATYSKKIAEGLTSLGYKVALLCYGEERGEKYPFLVKKVTRKYPLFFHYFNYFWKLLFLSLGTQIIYAQGPVSSGWPALWVKKILGKKLVVKVVGDYAWEQFQNQNDNLKFINLEEFQKMKVGGKIRWLQRIEQKVCQKADVVITPSYYLKKIVASWGVAEEKIKVIYNAAEIEIPLMSKNQAKEQIKLSGDLIVSGGRLVKWKGFIALIEIMPRLLAINPNFKLIIIGAGPEEKNLKFKIKNLKLENNVFLIGQILHQDLLIYLRAGDMFVLNSGYEGLSHVLLEAMAAGVPIIASNIGGNPELIKHNHNGLLVEYNNKEEIFNAVCELWRDKNLQNKFVNNSEEVLEKFKFSKMIEETIKILK